MSEEYTPTLDELRLNYGDVHYKNLDADHANGCEVDEEFNRRIAAVEREAAARALEEAASVWAADPDSWGDNEKDYRNELRARAPDPHARRGAHETERADRRPVSSYRCWRRERAH